MNHHRSRSGTAGLVFLLALFCLLALGSGPVQHAKAATPAADLTALQTGYDPSVQPADQVYNEAQTVYLGNLARQANGVPPLRWNRQLTYAARWFSWDSAENRPGGFCGHQDTQGQWPSYRALAFGYLGFAGAENAFCGYLSPQDAINGWMNSPGHRANLLDPNWREIGLGYYLRTTDGRGYVTQDFGTDAAYAPVVINNEALFTTSPNVNLYIYNRATGGGFAGIGPIYQMMVSNSPHFTGATWEPYSANKAWTLASGTGWRNVYVKTHDKFSRDMTSSDAIYLGATLPTSQLGIAQMASTQPSVTLYGLNGGALPQVQLSMGWMADDTFGSFKQWWGNGGSVSDSSAWGGTAYRLTPGNGESFAWVYDTTFIKNIPMVAYFRLKVNDNTSSSEVARISVKGGGTEYGPLSLKGTDFAAPNQYQEFPINFTFNDDPNDAFLFFNFWRSGDADLYVDVVTIFTAPRATTSPLTWTIPGRNYRGQGVWVRYTNGTQFSSISLANTVPYTIMGNAGAPWTVLHYFDGSDKTVTADGNGAYSITVPKGWNGSVTPTHPCYTFTPGSIPYGPLTDDQKAQSYTASPSGACTTSTYTSNPLQDGTLLESSETSGLGGTMNYADAYLLVGDDAQDRQYRSIVSFNTADIPETATITNVTLRLRSAGPVGSNLFATLGNLLADVRKGSFSSNGNLQLVDFQAIASKNAAWAMGDYPVNGWYSKSLAPADFAYINTAGVTQFRIRFTRDDNDDLRAEYLKLYSGNSPTSAYWPQLVVQYK